MLRMLLTSDGPSNASIVEALLDLLSRNPEDCRVVYVPTAKNLEPYRDEPSRNLAIYGTIFDDIEVVDIAVGNAELWGPLLTNADVLIFGGGDPFYLQHQIENSGLGDLLRSGWASEKVLVGTSAGSMVFGSALVINPEPEYEEYLRDAQHRGMGFVDFSILPHLNGERCGTTLAEAERAAKDFAVDVYAIDDSTALCVRNGQIQVVSEGLWRKFEAKE
jgi:dipeptidase E